MKNFATALLGLSLAASLPVQAQELSAADRTLAHDLFKQLIETNTTDSVGSSLPPATAMRQRLLDAGFAPKDAVLLGTE